MKGIGGIVGFVLLLLFVIHTINVENETFGDSMEHGQWRQECVYGQTVFVTARDRKAAAVNALDEDGKPVPCGNNRRGNYDVPNSNY